MKKLNVAIIGSGVIGEAAGRGLLKKGHAVVFCDINQEKLSTLQQEGFTVSTPDDLSDHATDVYLISIQTPTTSEGVDLSSFKKALVSVGKALASHNSFPVVATRSTVPVGTAMHVVTPLLEQHSGKKMGEDFGVASNPEFLREQTALDDFLHMRLVVIGSEDKRSKEILETLYKPFHVPLHFISTAEAEMLKYTHNLLNATKISFFNEQRRVCEARGVNADAIFPIVVESAEASWNPRYGTKNLGPYSGACLPKDVQGFLESTARELAMDLPLLKAVDNVNEQVKRESKEKS